VNTLVLLFVVAGECGDWVEELKKSQKCITHTRDLLAIIYPTPSLAEV
jgi:hypothetical protein